MCGNIHEFLYYEIHKFSVIAKWLAVFLFSFKVFGIFSNFVGAKSASVALKLKVKMLKHKLLYRKIKSEVF